MATSAFSGIPGKALGHSASPAFAAGVASCCAASRKVNIPAPTLQPDGPPALPPAGTPRPNRAYSTIELKSSDGNSWYKALIVGGAAPLGKRAVSAIVGIPVEPVDTTQASTFFSYATNGTTSAFPEFGTDYNRGPADWDAPHNWGVQRRVGRGRPSDRRVPCSPAGRLAGIGHDASAASRLTVFVQNNRFALAVGSPSLGPGMVFRSPDLVARPQCGERGARPAGPVVRSRRRSIAAGWDARQQRRGGFPRSET